MAKAAKPTPADLELWRRVVEQVRPLPGRRAPAPPSPVASPAPEPLRRSAAAPPEGPGAKAAKHVHPPRSLSHGVVADLDRRSAERLTRGKLPIDGRLDLHGMTQADAFAALTSFLAVSRSLGRRCVLIITGKGRSREEGGVLRRQVPLWLNQPALRPQILAFNYSQPQHGGDGALYVLLRRQR